jgi:tRNA G10  N-methylase Trm11
VQSRGYAQAFLFPVEDAAPAREATSSTFVDNMKLPVHRWFRYSAGFSAQWAEATIRQAQATGAVTVLDPFAGAGTTLLAAEKAGVPAIGVDAHPFVSRVAKAKLLYRSDPNAFLARAREVKRLALRMHGIGCEYPTLIHKCFSADALESLDHLRRAWEELADDTPESELTWLTLVAILRPDADDVRRYAVRA